MQLLTSSLRPRILYLNCTGIQAHLGCIAVTHTHLGQLLAAGYDFQRIYPTFATRFIAADTAADALQRIATSAIADDIDVADAVVINGEGTIHHDRGRDLLHIAQYAKRESKPVFIVNAVIQEMSGDYLDILRTVDDLAVREPASAAYLSAMSVAHRLVPDSFLEADFAAKPTRHLSGRTLVTDWHPSRDTDVGIAMLNALNAVGDAGLFYPLHDITYVAEEQWRHQIANLSTADLIITGRHHGAYAALLAGRPFVMLSSNTHKVEGLSQLSGGRIPFSPDGEGLKDLAAGARADPDLFKDLQEQLRSWAPLGTFDPLLAAVPSAAPRGDMETRAALAPLWRCLLGRATDFWWQRAAQSALHHIQMNARIVSLTHKIRARTDQVNSHHERLKSAELKIAQLKASNEVLQKRVLEASHPSAAKLEKITRQLSKAQQTIGQLYFRAGNSIAAWHAAARALDLDPLAEGQITLLFKSQPLVPRADQRKYDYANKLLSRLHSLEDSEAKLRALAKACSFGPDYACAADCYDRLEKIVELDVRQRMESALCHWAIGRFDRAATMFRAIFQQAVASAPPVALQAATQLIGVLNQSGRFDEAISFLDAATALGVRADLGGVYVSHLGKGNFGTAWQLCRDEPEDLLFPKYFAAGIAKLGAALAGEVRLDHVVLTANGGVGDEIRTATLYSELEDLVPDRIGTLIMTCDHRLEPLLSRTFPRLNFVPVSRYYIQNPADLRKTTPHELRNYFNDASFKLAKNADAVAGVFSLLQFMRRDYADFLRNRRVVFTPTPSETEHTRSILAGLGRPDRPKIGIGLGTHLSAAARALNVFRLSDFVETFRTVDADFVVLSFDVDADEIRQLSDQGITNLFWPADIDLKDDLALLMALVAELDLVVSPPNMLIDLAGTVGAASICLFTTHDYRWRFPEPDLRDVWHTNVFGLCPERAGDKAGLLEALPQAILRHLGKVELPIADPPIPGAGSQSVP
ncbi:MAG: polysaccharide pyruvyl transferase family protein [Rhodospirillaceae bacterium]|nr:polysaccharide pyruvyl transferase family protein [Rhodospirillaceae bacterium]